MNKHRHQFHIECRPPPHSITDKGSRRHGQASFSTAPRNNLSIVVTRHAGIFSAAIHFFPWIPA